MFRYQKARSFLNFYKSDPLKCSSPCIIILQETLRRLSTTTIVSNNTKVNPLSEEKDTINNLIDKFGSKLLYSTIVEERQMKRNFKINMLVKLKKKRYNEKSQIALQSIQPLPLSLKYLMEEEICDASENAPTVSSDNEINKPERETQFPFSENSLMDEKNSDTHEFITAPDKTSDSLYNEMKDRSKELKNWMTAYDNSENDLVEEEEDGLSDWKINYGTPDPKSSVSKVPCGGCGAYLHCKDTAIPGYIPSEIFKNAWKQGAAPLEAIVCQRCFFLKEHNLALQVRVSPEDYPKVLDKIPKKKALMVLMVDLMDFPCSIWPGIADIVGDRTPVFVVGNKVDLLPKDCSNFLGNVKQKLLDQVKLSGFGSSNILGAALISAKTGYGIEDLITSLQSLWKHKGDVYLVGCTNVGKSSLFNALLRSDYCKIQAADLIQRATISQWPGTTINLLKFPIMRPSGYRLFLRHQRIKALKQMSAKERRVRSEELRISNTASNATLIGHIGQTFVQAEDDRPIESLFSVQGNPNASGKVVMGINEKHPDYVASRWCFDTPGVVQPDQIINLLTLDELMFTLPKELIRPKTFCVKPGTSLFIAGLARLDYLEGPGSIRLTVFRSNELPITICTLDEAHKIYEEYLGTDLFKVPVNENDRLSKWPGLHVGKPFSVTGTHWKHSCVDVVLSSAGWVAVNCGLNDNYKFQAWTPEKRGIHLRDCILPKAVTLRGARLKYTVAYKTHKFI
ncbi:hypothetical protein JTB14_011126 [Gonioctena quinquepunctata]|nr:hypothetical protein JTB14_011126 [Gonioctena quinquepunctata]